MEILCLFQYMCSFFFFFSFFFTEYRFYTRWSKPSFSWVTSLLWTLFVNLPNTLLPPPPKRGRIWQNRSWLHSSFNCQLCNPLVTVVNRVWWSTQRTVRDTNTFPHFSSLTKSFIQTRWFSCLSVGTYQRLIIYKPKGTQRHAVWFWAWTWMDYHWRSVSRKIH